MKYDLVLIDPPWSFKVWSDKGKDRSAENHYRVMSFEDILQIPVLDLCNRNCALVLWATSPMLPLAVRAMEYWGFVYTNVLFTWIKENKKLDSLFTGLGYYTRANPEFALLGMRKHGSPLKVCSHSVHSVIKTRIRSHSEKPDEAQERIEKLFGDINRVELFAR